MARAAKSALVLCMDVGFSMSNSEPGQEPSFEQAKKVIQKFVQRQVFAENKDEVGLVLFGTDGTKNGLAKDGQYENITVHRHLMMPDFELLEEIESELQPGGQQADWLDALVVCMDLLQKETMGKKFERLNIVLLTDLNVQTSADQLDVIIDSLKKAGITLQFFLPFPVDGEDRADGGGDGPGPSAAPARPGKGLSRQQTQGLEMVKNIMTSLEEEDSLEEVYTFSDALQKLSIFKRIDRRPMAWPCQLTIGSSLTIRIVGYKAVTEEKVKKSWAIVEAQSHQRDDVKRETVYCLDDDNETEVQKDDTIQGFRYGSDIVPFSKVDEDQMKYKSDGKCFSVLGFTKQELIRRHQFMGSQVVKVFAPRDDEHAAVALSALIRALDSLKMAAIVRYAYDRRSNPQVGAAFPCIKEKYECLLYVQLPFMEDLRQFTFPVLENNKKFTPSASQLSAVDALIDSMMLVEKDEDGESVDVFKVNHFPNPQFQRLFQCLHHRGVNPDDPLPPVEPWLKRDLERPQAVSARCQTALQDVKTKFPLKVVVKKKEQKTSADVFGSSADEPDAKKVKVDEETEFNLAEIAKGNITSRIDAFAYALLTAPAHNVLHQSGNAELFNSYMQSLKRSVPDRNLQEFWDLLIQDALTLISKDEVDGSTFSKQDANQFLAFEQKEEVQAAPVQEDTGDVDDLLDMM
ncbi:X-ray repair cross-complementing protein 5 [Sinocyclocheilus grahami]|uniref:X-ray repair cross-complementing protein 5 n=1 Tax=Sinocyclocheilus grahami TaxID=75366 RepID=UPI0007ACFFB5|nr:PREDICTED: X-ray repair cross-complementing protein 5-like [Sinocyclocheilus grahami]